MEVSVSEQQGRVPVTIFRVTGDIDSATYQTLQNQVEDKIQSGTRNVVMDLTEVGYLSSAGIRLLSHMFNELRTTAPEDSDEAIKQGVRAGTFKSPHLKLVSPTPRVAEVIKMSGLDMMIESYPSVPEAVAAF
jgi:anti-anti-sigma factor